MNSTIELPLWLFLLILLFAAVTFASHFLFPSVRWFLRRRMERVVARLNQRLERPIQPFKLVRRHDTIQRLIHDPEVIRAVTEHAAAEDVREDVAFETAGRYAREIVPSFSASAYFGIATRAARWLGEAVYDVELVHSDHEALSEIDPEATVVFVMNHRSNMDYVLVTYIAARQSALSYAVGEWARVWPISSLIRAMGAYFIRRKSRNPLYRRVLARYVRLATDSGVTQAMFPEGGLSLDGALAPPRMGILKYLVEGADTSTRDLVFVPVALNYDRVLEDRILIAANEAGERRFHAKISVVAGFVLKKLWQKLRGRYRKFGHASVSFGAPLHLSDWQTGPDTGLDDLATELMHRIGQAIPVLPVPLTAMILLDAGSGGLDREDLVRRAETLLGAGRASMPETDAATLISEGLDLLKTRGLITEDEAGLVQCSVEDLPVLGYYAASIAHIFASAEPGGENSAAAKL